MSDYQNYFEANKKLWNNKTAVHYASAFYDLNKFKSNINSLNPVELAEVGDVKGKSMLHLQCHFGMDTLSWAKLGAETTGLDFSEEAISKAKALAKEVNINSNFVCANVYETSGFINDSFDIVYTSYGTIGWLPDLALWANVIAQRLKPGGEFYMVDFHPIVWMFDSAFSHFKYSYFNDGPIEEEQTGTYADREADLHDKEYGWNHSISEILNALINAGLKINFFNEHLSSPYECFSNMVMIQPGNFQIKGLENKIPMLYSIKALKVNS